MNMYSFSWWLLCVKWWWRWLTALINCCLGLRFYTHSIPGPSFWPQILSFWGSEEVKFSSISTEHSVFPSVLITLQSFWIDLATDINQSASGECLASRLMVMLDGRKACFSPPALLFLRAANVRLVHFSYFIEQIHRIYTYEIFFFFHVSGWAPLVSTLHHPPPPSSPSVHLSPFPLPHLQPGTRKEGLMRRTRHSSFH